MKKKVLIILTVMVCVLSACKKDSWVDWRLQNQLWIENISKQEGVITTPTGLRYKIIEKGDTTQRQPDDIKSVKITYKGYLIGPYSNATDYNAFDQNTNAILAISDLISGFAEGLKKMYPQSHYMLYIPYDLGYGADGAGTEGGMGYIPPYSTLIFDVTLKQIY